SLKMQNKISKTKAAMQATWPHSRSRWLLLMLPITKMLSPEDATPLSTSRGTITDSPTRENRANKIKHRRINCNSTNASKPALSSNTVSGAVRVGGIHEKKPDGGVWTFFCSKR